jgi:type IV pilus assembly protein PilZ
MSPADRHDFLKFSIKDTTTLQANYMAFVENGGLFIPTSKTFALDDEVYLLLQLMDEPDAIAITDKFVWVTPVGAEGNKSAGVGLQFQGDEGNALRNKIEAYLGGALKSDRLTHTM